MQAGSSPSLPHAKLQDLLLKGEGQDPKITQKQNPAPPCCSRPTACGAGLLQLRRDALHPPHIHAGRREAPGAAAGELGSTTAPGPGEPERGRSERSGAGRGAAERSGAPPRRWRRLPRHPRRRGAGRGAELWAPAGGGDTLPPSARGEGCQPRSLPGRTALAAVRLRAAPPGAACSAGLSRHPRPGPTWERSRW